MLPEFLFQIIDRRNALGAAGANLGREPQFASSSELILSLFVLTIAVLLFAFWFVAQKVVKGKDVGL